MVTEIQSIAWLKIVFCNRSSSHLHPVSVQVSMVVSIAQKVSFSKT